MTANPTEIPGAWLVDVRLSLDGGPGRTRSIGPTSWTDARRLCEVWESEFGDGTAAIREDASGAKGSGAERAAAAREMIRQPPPLMPAPARRPTTAPDGTRRLARMLRRADLAAKRARMHALLAQARLKAAERTLDRVRAEALRAGLQDLVDAGTDVV